ncbi:ABC transporter permease [Anaerosacchariphilus polymeriproducens]|uniref:Multidrug ABC transporter permease n=1 Tax=Anaerosacchariphilus polymeriproducens TaxID=1812858 RepID=A0A371AS36_9FIRM|nr:ABC-2 family transporter protein [Anaerosacchariphilus polymeriproducens]RDU22376.1 multidrug ABC transporter permease [Anaerosacchariphilus polymeriproducens]
MREIKQYLHLYKVFTFQFIKGILQSKVDFLIGLFGFFIVQFTNVYFLFLIFNKISTIQGWSFNQVLFIYGFSLIPRGIDHFFTDNIWTLAWQLVLNGDFDRYMLRPLNLLFQVICERIQPDAFGELIVGILLLISSISKDVVQANLLNCVAFVISIIVGTIIYTSIKLIYASLAFWFKISGPFLYTAYQIADFAKYPITIYSRVIRIIISWIVPFAFVAFYPSTFFLHNNTFLQTIGIECIIAVIFSIISYYIFIKGTKNYESVGN